MGIDGLNTLHIRGPTKSLDELETSYLVLNDKTDNIETARIVSNLLGPQNAEMCHRTPNYLVFTYPYRNEPIYSYLIEILSRHPQCWLKNEYQTDEGLCGLWIATMSREVPAIQELKWLEPSIEDRAHCKDFSSPY